jgi:hypothetical protein
LRLCDNYQTHSVCNRCIRAESESGLCDFCNCNLTIPNLSAPGNLEKWRKLEAAKRRVLHGVIEAGFPLLRSDSPDWLSLRFAFKEGAIPTGHADGCITINLCEADDVQREITRVQFGEPQRSLIGHFRHELGHYYWELLVRRGHLEGFRSLFGNEQEPAYAEAQERYYNSGPQDNWTSRFISAYASMHPWEDFAETFAAYLDMAAILDTAEHFRIGSRRADSADAMVLEYQKLGIIVNELNRDLGLLDLVPEVFTPAVIEKLRFVHKLRAITDPSARE